MDKAGPCQMDDDVKNCVGSFFFILHPLGRSGGIFHSHRQHRIQKKDDDVDELNSYRHIQISHSSSHQFM